MPLTHLSFFVFFVVVVIAACCLRGSKLYKPFLLFACFYFYSCFDYRYIPLLCVPIVLDYYFSTKIAVEEGRARKVYLYFSLITNLSVLCVFKYYNFFLDSIFESSPALIKWHFNIIMPLGISFYTFSSMSYVIDVYNGTIRKSESLLDYALYLSFFPKISAGPISRASFFLPQLNEPPAINLSQLYEGGSLILIGLLKKVFFADRLASYVNSVVGNYAVYDGATLFVTALAYSVQIYLDFSGYTDIARGAAKCLGYDLEINFNYPYLAKNISDFWRRWHITLSAWIKDYLYIPLGGNRCGFPRSLANAFIAMSLCGLWHGASWSFVLWGAYHGILIIIYRCWVKFSEFELPNALSVPVTFFFVSLGWILFRIENVTDAFHYIHAIFINQSGIRWINPFSIFAIFCVFLNHTFKIFDIKFIKLSSSSFVSNVLLLTIFLVLLFLYPKEFAPFIYAVF